MKSTTTRTLVKSAEQVRAARMTPEQSARFQAMTDDEIDFSDIPDQGDTGWTRVNPLKHPAASANGAGKRKARAR